MTAAVSLWRTLTLWMFFKSASAGTFWQITDVHVDDNYTASGAVATYCHVDSGNVVQWFGRNGCGLPWRTVQAAIDFMSRQNEQPDFIVWTGDTAPYWPYPDWSHVFTKLRRVTEMLREAFPQIPIYPAIGNHDAYPSDQLPADNNSFYAEYLRRSGWESILDAETHGTFIRGGYYTVKPSDNLRIIVLNTNLYYGKNQLANTADDPSGQLSWLVDTLEEASSSAEKPAVLIVSHIAGGFPHWSTQKPAIHSKINERFLNALGSGDMSRRIGHLFGHEHIDTFKCADVNIAAGGIHKTVTLGFLVSPAVYPGSGELDTNPGVRMYTYSADTATLHNYQQFHMDLKAANEAYRQSGSTAAIDFWRQSYSATRFYNASDLSAQNLRKIAASLQNKQDLFASYWRMSDGGYSQRPCDLFCIKERVCMINSLTSVQMNRCMSHSVSSAVSLSAVNTSLLTMVAITVAFSPMSMYSWVISA